MRLMLFLEYCIRAQCAVLTQNLSTSVGVSLILILQSRAKVFSLFNKIRGNIVFSSRQQAFILFKHSIDDPSTVFLHYRLFHRTILP